MRPSHSRTLAIETGVSCNNRCVFCYQLGYRSLPDHPRLLDAEEVRARMRWGIENGFDEVSLTGGEPTLRPDFLDLVRFARSIGYPRIAVTTNGCMLARPAFFDAAVEAGLTSIGVSIHGPSAEVHDGLTGRTGSFVRAVQAVRNAVATRGGAREVQLNTFTVVNRRNHRDLVALADLLAALGVDLMVFQPVLLSKSNAAAAAGESLDLPDLAEAIGRVAARGPAKGYRTKLFNLPPCLFFDALAGIEMDAYTRAVFHEQDARATDARPVASPDGYVRLDACAACSLPGTCPGLHVTLLPQDDLVDHVERCIAGVRREERGALWLAGTDLLRADGISRVVTGARRAGFREVALTAGGTGIAGAAGFEAAREAGVHRIVLVHQANEPASSDRLIRHAGNDVALAADASRLLSLRGQDAPLATLLVSPCEAAIALLERPEFTVLRDRGMSLRIRAPWRRDVANLSLKSSWRHLEVLLRTDGPGGPPTIEVPWPSPVEAFGMMPVFALALRGRARIELGTVVLPTRLLDRRYTVLNWSTPETGGWPAARRQSLPDVPELVCRSLAVRPIAAGDLEKRGAR